MVANYIPVDETEWTDQKVDLQITLGEYRRAILRALRRDRREESRVEEWLFYST